MDQIWPFLEYLAAALCPCWSLQPLYINQFYVAVLGARQCFVPALVQHTAAASLNATAATDTLRRLAQRFTPVTIRIGCHNKLTDRVFEEIAAVLLPAMSLDTKWNFKKLMVDHQQKNEVKDRWISQFFECQKPCFINGFMAFWMWSKRSKLLRTWG